MIVMIFFEKRGQGHKKNGSNESPFRKENKENGHWTLVFRFLR